MRTCELDAYFAIVSEKMNKYSENPGDKKTCSLGQWSLQRQKGRPELDSIFHSGQRKMKFKITNHLSNNSNSKTASFQFKISFPQNKSIEEQK